MNEIPQPLPAGQQSGEATSSKHEPGLLQGGGLKPHAWWLGEMPDVTEEQLRHIVCERGAEAAPTDPPEGDDAPDVADLAELASRLGSPPSVAPVPLESDTDEEAAEDETGDDIWPEAEDFVVGPAVALRSLQSRRSSEAPVAEAMPQALEKSDLQDSQEASSPTFTEPLAEAELPAESAAPGVTEAVLPEATKVLHDEQAALEPEGLDQQLESAPAEPLALSVPETAPPEPAETLPETEAPPEPEAVRLPGPDHQDAQEAPPASEGPVEPAAPSPPQADLPESSKPLPDALTSAEHQEDSSREPTPPEIREPGPAAQLPKKLWAPPMRKARVPEPAEAGPEAKAAPEPAALPDPRPGPEESAATLPEEQTVASSGVQSAPEPAPTEVPLSTPQVIEATGPDKPGPTGPATGQSGPVLNRLGDLKPIIPPRQRDLLVGPEQPTVRTTPAQQAPMPHELTQLATELLRASKGKTAPPTSEPTRPPGAKTIFAGIPVSKGAAGLGTGFGAPAPKAPAQERPPMKRPAAVDPSLALPANAITAHKGAPTSSAPLRQPPAPKEENLPHASQPPPETDAEEAEAPAKPRLLNPILGLLLLVSPIVLVWSWAQFGDTVHFPWSDKAPAPAAAGDGAPTRSAPGAEVAPPEPPAPDPVPPMEPPTPGLPELQQPPEVPDPDTDTLTDPTIDEPTPVIPEQVPRATPIDPVTFEPFEE